MEGYQQEKLSISMWPSSQCQALVSLNKLTLLMVSQSHYKQKEDTIHVYCLELHRLLTIWLLWLLWIYGLHIILNAFDIIFSLQFFVDNTKITNQLFVYKTLRFFLL